MEWLVYILECKDGRFYTGITNDLTRRLKEHNNGRGCRFTKFRIPVKLIHKESYPSREEALRREAEIKGWKKNRKLALLSV